MAWDKADPQGTTKVSDSPAIFQGNWEAIEDFTELEHGSLAAATSGMHVPGKAGVVWTGTLSALSGAISAPPTGAMAIASASSDGRNRIYINTSTSSSGTWAEQVFPHNALADLTSGNPHTQYVLSAATLTATTFTATALCATTISATTYLNTLSSLPEPLTATNVSATTFSSTNVKATTITATTITGSALCGTTISATSVLGVEPTVVWSVPGVLASGSASVCSKFTMPFAATITKAYAVVTTAPTTQSIIIDIRKNGTTIWSTTGNRLTITATNTTATQTSFDTTALVEGDLLDMIIYQVGSGTTGAYLTVELKVKR